QPAHPYARTHLRTTAPSPHAPPPSLEAPRPSLSHRPTQSVAPLRLPALPRIPRGLPPARLGFRRHPAIRLGCTPPPPVIAARRPHPPLERCFPHRQSLPLEVHGVRDPVDVRQDAARHHDILHEFTQISCMSSCGSRGPGR
ncbi:hypothetical protein U9M48_012871, partial [Paspalum notatum var. saurae]